MYIFSLEETLIDIKNWSELKAIDCADFMLCPPKRNNIYLLKTCYYSNIVKILTSFSEKHRQTVTKWCKENSIYCDELVMRPDNCNKTAQDFKVDRIIALNNKNNVRIVFDNNPNVVFNLLKNDIPALMVI